MHSYPNLDNFHRPCSFPTGGASKTGAALSSDDIAGLADSFLFAVDAPALTVSQLPNGETATYALVFASDAALSNIMSTVVMGVQTGGGGVGAPAATFACKLPANAARYLGLKITASASANVSALPPTNLYVGTY